MATALQYRRTRCMFTPTQPIRTDVQMTALFRTTLRVCVKERDGEKEERSDGKWLLLKVITDRERFNGKIGT